MTSTPLAVISPYPTRESLRLLATLALDAYDRRHNWPGCEVRTVDDAASGMSATIVADPSRIVISFRGTEPRDWRDWKRDANFRLVPYYRGGLVHSGFWSGWVALRSKIREAGLEIRDAVERTSGGTHPHVVSSSSSYSVMASAPFLVVNGHSLGGAVATLAAEELNAGLCVTFGSPRVGCDFFAKGFDRRRRHTHLRVVNGNDLVTRCPFPLPYRHCGELVYLDRNHAIRPDHPWHKVLFDRVRQFRFDCIRDHLLGRYLEALS